MSIHQRFANPLVLGSISAGTVFSVILGAGVLLNRVTAVENKNVEQDKKIEVLDDKIDTDRALIAEMRTNVQYIKDTLTEIKTALKELK